MRWLSKIFFLCFCVSTLLNAQNLSIGALGDSHLSHPLFTQTETQSLRHSFTMLPLISLEKGWNWQCRLCTQLPSLANKGIELFTDKTGVQKLAIHIEVPQDVKWGDGQPLTLKDVAFTWQLIQNLPPSSRSPNLLQEIDYIYIRPEETRHFTIQLRGVMDPYPILNAFIIVSSHIDEALYEKDKAHYFENTNYINDAKNPGLYNGSFLVEAVKDTVFNFTRNAHALFIPKLENIQLQFFTSTNEIGKALQSGTINMALDLSAWNETLSMLNTLDKKAFTQISSDSYFFEHIDFNLYNPIFQDSHVRKALAHAIDKEVLLKTLTQDWTIPAVSPVHPGDPFFSSNVSLYPFSPKKAQELLASADWQLGNQGICTKRARALSFEILTVEDPMRIRIANYLVKAWKVIGAQATVKTLSLYDFREALAQRKFSGLALYAWKLTPFENPKTLYHSNAVPSLNNAYSGQNLPGWINTRVDDALAKFASSINIAERKRSMDFFQQSYTSELPSIPLFFRTNVTLLPKNLSSFSLPPTPAAVGIAAAEWK